MKLIIDNRKYTKLKKKSKLLYVIQKYTNTKLYY